MGCCLQRENLPPTDLFNSKRFYQHKISTFRNNCPSGGVLLDPHFVKLGRRVVFVLRQRQILDLSQPRHVKRMISTVSNLKNAFIDRAILTRV